MSVDERLERAISVVSQISDPRDRYESQEALLLRLLAAHEDFADAAVSFRGHMREDGAWRTAFDNQDAFLGRWGEIDYLAAHRSQARNRGGERVGALTRAYPNVDLEALTGSPLTRYLADAILKAARYGAEDIFQVFRLAFRVRVQRILSPGRGRTKAIEYQPIDFDGIATGRFTLQNTPELTPEEIRVAGLADAPGLLPSGQTTPPAITSNDHTAIQKRKGAPSPSDQSGFRRPGLRNPPANQEPAPSPTEAGPSDVPLPMPDVDEAEGGQQTLGGLHLRARKRQRLAPDPDPDPDPEPHDSPADIDESVDAGPSHRLAGESCNCSPEVPRSYKTGLVGALPGTRTDARALPLLRT